MASPVAFKMGPLTNGLVPSKGHVLLVAIIICAGALPAVVLETMYACVLFKWNPLAGATGTVLPAISLLFQGIIDVTTMLDPWASIVAWLLFPLDLLAAFYLYVLSSLIVARFFLLLETAVCKPKEGIFPRDMKNRDYRHWNTRRLLKKFPCWLLQLVPFPWLRGSFIYNQLGTRVSGTAQGLFSAWIDVEFVTIDDGVLIGRNAAITSHYFTPEYLIVKAVHVEKDAIIGEKARIPPGVTIGERATVLARSVLRLDEHVPAGACVGGNPAAAVDLG